MDKENFNNINILEAANIVFFHEEHADSILEELMKVEDIGKKVSIEIQKHALALIAEKGSQHTQKFLEENLAYLCNLSMLIKKKGKEDEYER